MTPVSYNGNLTILIAVLAKTLQAALADSLPMIVTALICASAAPTFIVTTFKPALVLKNAFLKTLFYIIPVWLILRLLAVDTGSLVFI
jgi:nucleoside recognition membrane protein YjiH